MFARPLDHLVMPVTDLATARTRLTALGFTVASDARHPFGTENACVYFADKTYLEPLAIASAAECMQSAKSGNQFTARNNAYRFRKSPEGLSSCAFASNDADADDALFRGEGLSGGDILQFSRGMKLPDGSEITPTFRLAFAADLRSPDFHAFTCQRINVPQVDRSALELHANGATGIKTVVLSEVNPVDFLDFLRIVVGDGHMGGDDGGFSIDTANTTIDVCTPAALKSDFGLDVPDERGLHGQIVHFTVADLMATELLLASNGIAFTKHNHMLFVPHQAGQGVPFAFSE